MRKTTWLAGLAGAPIVATGSSAPGSAQQIDIKISHATALESTKGQTWEHFKQLAEERLGDRVLVRHHHSAQLYGQEEGISALQAGAVQLISPGAPLMTGVYPRMALFGLPFMFEPAEEVREVAADPEAGGKIFAEMPEKGLKFLAFWLNGYRLLGNSKRPIEKLEDLEGLKIRVPGGKVYRDTFAALGGNVVAVSWSEIVTALQQGTVDAIEPTASNWWADNLYELAPYITDTNHILSTYVVATNAQWWEGLPEDIRSELEEIMAETTEYNWQMVQEANQHAIEQMKADGATFTELSPEEKQRWFEQVKPVHAQYEDVIGKDILDATYEIIQ